MPNILAALAIIGLIGGSAGAIYDMPTKGILFLWAVYLVSMAVLAWMRHTGAL